MPTSNSSIKTRDSGLAGRIERLVLSFEPSEPMDGFCFHLNFSDITYDQQEFARVLFATLPLFALKPEEYEEFQLNSPSEAGRVAYDRITKNESLSDYGEVLLFLILDFFFDTPKFVTKVRTRTSENVAVFGSDCAHVSFGDKGQPILWLGEAKFKEDFSGAVTDALDSIKNILTVNNLKSELRLLNPHIEANSIFDESFLAQIKEITRNAVPIGDFEINIPILIISNSRVARESKSLDELQGKLEAECVKKFQSIAKKDWPIMNKVKLHFILFPLSNKAELVKELGKYAA